MGTRITPLVHLILAATLSASAPAPGAYAIATGTVYAGPEEYPAGHLYTEYYDSRTRRFGELRHVNGSQYETAQKPVLRFSLTTPFAAVVEDRMSATDTQGTIGFSLWHVADARSLPTVLLIHGSDDETRDMGFIIPYFVAHGLNVVSYDQRGTGESVGDWHSASVEEKAADVLAILAQIAQNPAVDAKRIGLWGTSNGGWVAPIVATRFPVVFMILRSAPSESVQDNVLFEIRQTLAEHHKFSAAQIADALSFERTLFESILSDSNWPHTQRLLEADRTKPWLGYMRIPQNFTVPPSSEVLEQLQAILGYDPAFVLRNVRVPTLALFGARDRNVDAADSAKHFTEYFRLGGLADLTLRTFPNGDHVLEESTTGYLDQPKVPQRFVQGYPDVMIEWLHARGFASAL
jgi:alpha-beta hydrolase superfamily lysophospholipase